MALTPSGILRRCDWVIVGAIARRLRDVPAASMRSCRYVASRACTLPAGVKRLDVRLIDQESQNYHLDGAS